MLKHFKVQRVNTILSTVEGTYLFYLRVGDGGCDGHCITKDYLVNSSHSLREVTMAYTKASTDLDLSLNRCCSDYDEDTLPKEFLDAYARTFNMTPEEVEALVDRDFFPEIYLNLAATELENTRFYFIELQHEDIGGYGLVGT